MSIEAPHSRDVLTDWRDSWWNRDFLALMAERWRLGEVRRVLEVGSGLLHWTRALLPFLPEDATIVGVDKEQAWVEQGRARAAERGLADRIELRQGRADALPVESGAYDLATCQTVLMHVPDARAALREMIRAVRPGGLVAVAEPNNLAESVVRGTRFPPASLEVLTALLRLEYYVHAGKAARGHGDSSVGERLPGLFAEAGLTDIRVYSSDKTATLIPPYDGPFDQLEIAQRRDFLEKGLLCSAGDRGNAEACFRAGGGPPEEFEALWAAAVADQHQMFDAISAGTFHTAGGIVFYLVSGRKV